METEEKALADLILSIDAVHPPREAPLYMSYLFFNSCSYNPGSRDLFSQRKGSYMSRLTKPPDFGKELRKKEVRGFISLVLT